MLLATVAEKDLELIQFDVKIAFLYGKLDEEIYMEIPEGLENEEERRNKEVCKLTKSLYGLKQAPRCWNRKFSSFLEQFNLKESQADNCIFYGIYGKFEVYLALFVDDGLIASKSHEVLNSIIESFKKSFEIVTSDAINFVGLQIHRNRENKTMLLHQKAYIKRVIERFKMTDAKAVSVPADPKSILYPAETSKETLCEVPYREAVGSLMSLSVVRVLIFHTR